MTDMWTIKKKERKKKARGEALKRNTEGVIPVFNKYYAYIYIVDLLAKLFQTTNHPQRQDT